VTTVLVTGSSGFIGAQLCHDLASAGHDVIGVDKRRCSSREGSENFESIVLDLASDCLESKLPSRVDRLVHLAAESSVHRCSRDISSCIRDNVTATVNVAKWAAQAQIDCSVFASSMAVYGSVRTPASEESDLSGDSLYALSKRLGEKTFLAIPNSRNVNLRLFNVYGPGQSIEDANHGMVAIYLGQALRSGVIEVRGSGSRTRDFVYIADAISAVELALQELPSGSYNVATGSATSVEQLLHRLEQILRSGGRRISWHFTSETDDDISTSVGSSEKLRGFGWSPTTSLAQGLSLTAEEAACEI
jgi:UDP-glucose 4-epimerase